MAVGAGVDAEDVEDEVDNCEGRLLHRHSRLYLPQGKLHSDLKGFT